MAAKIVSPLTVHIFSFVYTLNKTVSWKYPLFDDSHSKRHELLSDCGFDLDHTDDESYRAHFHMPISHLYGFFFLGGGNLFPLPLHWRRAWQPTPVFLPGEFHGQRSLAGYSPRGHKELDTTEWLSLTHVSILDCLVSCGILWVFKRCIWLYTLYWIYACIFSSFGMLTFHFVVEKLKFDLILVVNFCFCFCVFSLVSRKITIRTNVEEFLTFSLKTFMVSNLKFCLSHSC